MSSFLRMREQFKVVVAENVDNGRDLQENGGDIEQAVSRLAESDDGVRFLNSRLPLFPNLHEVSTEIWLSTPEQRRSSLLELWAARDGIPIKAYTLCSGTDAPVKGMQ